MPSFTRPGETAFALVVTAQLPPIAVLEVLVHGIVTGIVGIASYRARFLGEANHAGTTPMELRRDALAGAKRHDGGVPERDLGRHLPGIADQRHPPRVPRQTVEIGPVEACERLESRELSRRRERFGVELDAGVRGVDPGAAASRFLGVARMRSRIRAEEELRIAAGRGLEHRIRFDHRVRIRRQALDGTVTAALGRPSESCPAS